MVGYCGDDDVIGSEFYVMERVVGTILRKDVPPDLGLDTEGVGTLCRNAVDTLVSLHDVDLEASGLGALDRGDGYVRRQVEGWTARYRRARTEDVGDLEATMAWLAEHQPADLPHVLVHNDFRFDNLVLDPDDATRVVGVLDWELATVGDPLMDLGSALAYWVQADDDPDFLAIRLQPTHTPGMLTRAEVVERYLVARGLDVTAERLAVLRGVRRLPPRRHRPADPLPLPPRPDDEPGVRRVPRGRPLPRPPVRRAHRRAP